MRLLGLTKDLRVMQRASIVTTACSSLSIAPADIPRFRAVHEEVCHAAAGSAAMLQLVMLAAC